MNLLLPDSGLIFWMTLIFVIVFIVLAKFGFPVITGMVERRNARIADSLEAARKAEEALEHLNREQERIVAETRAEQALLKKEAAADRERRIAVAREQARAEAQKIIDEAKVHIEEEKEAALKDMRREVALISLTVAEQILRKEMKTDEAQRHLVDRLVDEISHTTS